MRRWLIPVAAGASLLAALVLSAPGQGPKATEDVASPEGTDLLVTEAIAFDVRGAFEMDQQPAEDLEMAEDLEILGEVLRTNLTELYAPYALVASPRGSNRLSEYCRTRNCFQCHEGQLDASQLYEGRQFIPMSVWNLTEEFEESLMSVIEGTVERPDGAYLEGYGVVYQVRLDLPPPEDERPKETAAKAEENPPAGRSWENAGRSLRGEPPLEPPGAELPDPVMPAKADLVNTLVDVLAENARNLRHLRGEDRLTVAITFPREKSPTPAVDDGGDKISSSEEDEDDLATFSHFVMGDQTWLGDTPLIYFANTGETRGSHEVSGDLHMRQQNYQKAIEAYEKALEALGGGKFAIEGGDVKNVLWTTDLKAVAEPVLRKLIQAYAAAGELEKARTMIDRALASQPKSENRDASPKPAHAIPLPAKLVVTVTKSQLDDVAAGKMKREELNQHAEIHYFQPPPERPGLGSRVSRAAGEDGDMVILTPRKPRGAAFVELDNPWLSPEAGKKTDVQSPIGESPKGEKKEGKPRGSAY